MRSDGVPELVERGRQEFALLRRLAGERHLPLLLQGIVQIEPDAIELRGPGRQRIRLGRVEHVAHGERELIEIVLDAQQLQRVAAIAVGELGLQPPEAGDLAGDVPGVGDDRRQGDHQPEEEGGRR